MATGIPYFPQILAPQVVVGRLSEEPGPAEAIPFATLSARLLAIGLIGAALAGDITFTGTDHVGLVLNNLTTTQRDAIVSPHAGALIFNTTIDRPNYRSSAGWRNVAVLEDSNGFTGPNAFAPTAGVAINVAGAAQSNVAIFGYGSSGSPLAPGTDLINGYTGVYANIFTNGNMTTAAGVYAIVGDSHRNAGKNGIAVGGLFRAFNAGTWTADVTDGGAIALQCVADTTRGGTIFAFSANLDVSTTTGAIGRIAEFDSACTATMLSKYGIIIVSANADTATATDTLSTIGGRTINDSAALQIRNTNTGVGWRHGLEILTLTGAAQQVIPSTGSLFLADCGTVARGLDWYTMTFSDHAIGLGNVQKISWRNAANAAFIQGISVDSSDRVSLYGGQLTVNASGMLSLSGKPFADFNSLYTRIYDGGGSPTFILGSAGDATNYHWNTAHIFSSIGGSTEYLRFESTGVTITNAGSAAFKVGRLGGTTPAFRVDASTAVSITGLQVKSAASGGGVALSAIGETNVALKIDAAGSGTIAIGSVSTGAVTITPAATLSATLNVVGIISANGHSFGDFTTPYIRIYDGAANGAILLGGADGSDPTNYYRNTVHVFGSVAGSAEYLKLESTGTTITSAGASGLVVGRLGATTPALQVDASTATSITGVKIKSAASGGGVAISAIGETNVALAIDAAGSGTITFGGTSTGGIILTRVATLSGGLTYGGVNVNNAVTGTGNLVLSASPTFSGTVNAAALTASGAISGGSAAGSMVATQSDQETATSTSTLVSPGRQQFHPSAAKCWGYVTVSGGVPTLQTSYNITSISDDGVGSLGVVIATDFSSGNYAIAPACNTVAFGDTYSPAIGSGGAFSIFCGSAAAGFKDPNSYQWAAYGDQ